MDLCDTFQVNLTPPRVSLLASNNYKYVFQLNVSLNQPSWFEWLYGWKSVNPIKELMFSRMASTDESSRMVTGIFLIHVYFTRGLRHHVEWQQTTLPLNCRLTSWLSRIPHCIRMSRLTLTFYWIWITRFSVFKNCRVHAKKGMTNWA